jgi:VIT1/CCC1 family predicted Fe2+/Mn2+ transporter
MRFGRHSEFHRLSRTGWLRAAVLGANDGLVSTASLIVGVAAAATRPSEVMIAGVAGLVAGAMSMAAGEYVSVSSQADVEKADLARERKVLEETPAAEEAELAGIYRKRGLDAETALKVAGQLMAHDALGAHARDELGISEFTTARPIQAAFASAAAFASGAAAPLILADVVPPAMTIPTVTGASVVLLAILGCLGAKAGGAPMIRAAIRVTFWGAIAMALTAGVGRLVGTAV